MFSTANDKPGYPAEAILALQFTNAYGTVKTQCETFSHTLFLDHASEVKNGLIVEIGVFGGAHLLAIVDVCKKNNNKIVGVDPFETLTVFNGRSEEEAETQNLISLGVVRETWKQNRENLQQIIAEHKLDSLVELKVETSWKAAEKFADASIDLLHIDGDHSVEGVTKDLALYWPKMKVGGVVIMDDILWDCVRRAVSDFLALHPEIETQESSNKLWFKKICVQNRASRDNSVVGRQIEEWNPGTGPCDRCSNQRLVSPPSRKYRALLSCHFPSATTGMALAVACSICFFIFRLGS